MLEVAQVNFIGRKEELNTLEKEFRRDGSFVVIYGRRRIGKTTLIKEFIKGKQAFYFLATEEVESQSMKRLAGVVTAPQADVITGPAGILAANAMMGEITPSMALAVTQSAAQKILVPMNRCGIQMAGVEDLPLSEYIARAADLVAAACRG